jgi:ribonuclease R
MTRRGQRGPRGPKSDAAPANSSDWRGDDPNLELEKLRYAEPIASRELLLKHLSEAPEPLTAVRLAKRLGLDTDRQREALAKRLAAMVRDGQAIEGPNGFATAGEGERVAGRVRGRPNGDVLVYPDDGSAPLVLARADTASLMHHDRVEVLAVGMNDRGRRIARLIRRTGDGPTHIGGIWHAVAGAGRVEPEDPGHWYIVEVAARQSHGARDGDNGRRATHRLMGASSRYSPTCARRIWRRASPFCGMNCPRSFRRTCCTRRTCSSRTCGRRTARAAWICASCRS